MHTLIDQFEHYCLEYEEACNKNEHIVINRKHNLIQKTFLKIQKSNLFFELLHLLKNENEVVRLWVSSKLLPIFEKQCRPVLEDIAKSSLTNGSSAKFILDTYDGKELSFP